MLALLNAYADGYVAVPVIDACKKQGLFAILHEKQGLEFSALVKDLQANSGYLKIALHLLESLGWLRRNDDIYEVTDVALWKGLPEGLLELYQMSPDTLLQNEKSQKLVCFWIDFFIQQYCSSTVTTLSAWANRLAGALFIPLLLALEQNVVIQNGVMVGNLSLPLRQAIIALFARYEWGQLQQNELVLTELGSQLIERSRIMGIAASYRPMLLQMRELLFGDSVAVFKNKLDGTESHIDRDINVRSSGFQHSRYFKDAEKQIVNIFNQQPFTQQPRYIADMGCGDGTFLKQIYHAICKLSARGKVLKEYPLILLGIDYNEIALQTTQKNLEGLPHILLQGDINDPQKLLQNLQIKGIDDAAILHVRSFLDHNLHFSRNAASQNSTLNFPLIPGSVYVDTQGQSLSANEILEAWQQHLLRWSTVINSHGLIVLEAHCLSANLTRTYLGQSENFYFDHLHAFSKQYLIEAEIFLLLAARVGVFAKIQPLRYPKTLPFCRVTLSHFEKRNYQIRHASLQDLPQLEILEQHCWPQALQTNVDDLRTRIQVYPQGQFVLELNDQIVGVVYSQRIATRETILAMTTDTAAQFHQADGSYVQLLALNILPGMKKMHLGDQLLEWMLQYCSLMNGVNAVVGVTLCKNYHLQHKQLSDYIHVRDESGYLSDPILHFHELHGATIVGLVPNYRPNDVKNDGQGVLIYYDIHDRVHKQLQTTSAPTIENHINTYIEKLIKKCLGPDKQNFFSAETPLMEMGLDSADVLEITLQVSKQYQLELNLAFFFRYNTVTRVVRYLQKQLNQRSYAEIENL